MLMLTLTLTLPSPAVDRHPRRCSPAYYQWLGANSIRSPQVAAALLAAAAHLAGVDPDGVLRVSYGPPPPRPGSNAPGADGSRAAGGTGRVSARKALSGGGFFKAVALPDGRAAPSGSAVVGTSASRPSAPARGAEDDVYGLPGAAAASEVQDGGGGGGRGWLGRWVSLVRLPYEVERALTWQPWVQDWGEQALAAAQHPRLLLHMLRGATGAPLLANCTVYGSACLGRSVECID